MSDEVSAASAADGLDVSEALGDPVIAAAVSDEKLSGLSQLDRMILDFESKLWKRTALKERAISQQLGIAPMTYYQRLSALSEVEEAAIYAPGVIRKLRDAYSLREERKLT